jgi:hypothetical protein
MTEKRRGGKKMAQDGIQRKQMQEYGKFAVAMMMMMMMMRRRRRRKKV